MFKHNRGNLSHGEMYAMTKSGGDLFAVFQDEMGEIRVEYANTADYEDAAYHQIELSMRRGYPRSFTTSDVKFLIGSMMISRLHNYDFFSFMHLLDEKLQQVFDMRDLMEWIIANKPLFSSPAEQAVMADALNSADLNSEYDSMQKVAS